MLRDAVNLVEMLSTSIDFASYVLIFLGGGYVALHSRVMPRWAVTSLWYIGLAALLNIISIGIEWTVGSMHPLSYSQIGVVARTSIIFTLAVAVGMLFINTAWRDYLGSKARSANNLLASRTRRPPTKPTPAAKQPRKRVKAPGSRIKKINRSPLSSDRLII